MKLSEFIATLSGEYSGIRNQYLRGRYLPYQRMKTELDTLSSPISTFEIGRSEKNTPIHAVTLGTGKIKILGWSQMHGNESTTTKALFDVLNFFQKSEQKALQYILDRCSLMFIPMLNPDGADAYTRENYNQVDLNRDANSLTQKESRVLRACFDSFQPDFCLNLHDQRSIFSVGRLGKPATLSFLAPAMDKERTVNEVRIKAMEVIVQMNAILQDYIPNGIGRFDDAFNINCSGDRFQAFGVPTILFEAGHYPGDYLREKTRKYVFFALLAAIKAIIENKADAGTLENYLAIPENKKDYLDIILRNAEIQGEILDVGIQYEEQLKDGKVIFTPKVQSIEKELPFLGHKTVACRGEKVVDLLGNALIENVLVDGILLNREVILFKSE